MRMWLREGEKVEAEVDLIKSELKSETSECGTSTRWDGGGWECEHGGVEVEDQDGGEGGACFQAGEKQDMKLEGSASALEEVIITIMIIIIIIIAIITTRPKPAYGRQGLAGLWGQDTDQAGTFWGVVNISLRAFSPQLGWRLTWNHKKRPRIMKNHEDRPGTLNNHKNPPGTMNLEKP